MLFRLGLVRFPPSTILRRIRHAKHASFHEIRPILPRKHLSTTTMPRIERTSSKRKMDESDAEPELEEGGSQSQSQAQSQSQSQRTQASSASATPKPQKKKAKKGDESLPEYTGPTNKVLPMNIQIPAKPPGAPRVRIAAWNVSGFAASDKKGFKDYVAAEDADILVITETKLNQIPSHATLKQKYPHQYWSFASKKGYSGTAVLSKTPALSVSETIPGHPDPTDVKGRIITLEFTSCYVVGTYVVNAGNGLKTLEEKKLWNTHFFAHLHGLDKKKPVIWGGDLNVAPTAMDLANPKTNWNKTAGYTEAETTAFRDFLKPPQTEGATTSTAETAESAPTANKFLDIWRDLHPTTRGYTYFSYRFNCRAKGLGWRIDGFVVSERLQERVKMCEIREDIYGASDHLPIVIEIDGEL